MAAIKVKFITMLLLAAGAAACSKQQPSVVTGTIDVRLPQNVQPKVSMSVPQSGTGLALAWQAGDQLSVCGVSSSEKYTISDGFTAHEARFEGPVVLQGPFSVLYPGQKYSSVQEINARSYEGQVQKGNGTTGHLEWNALASDLPDYTHINMGEALRNAVLAISAQLPETVASVKYVSVTAPEAVFYTTNDREGGKSDTIRLDFEDLDLSSDHTLRAYAMTSWNDVTLSPGTRLVVTIFVSDTEKYTKKLSVPAGGITISGGKVNVIRLYKDAAGNFNGNIEGFIWSDDNFWE